MATPRQHWEIQITKQGYWRGVQHLYQNRYILSGPDPTAAQADEVMFALHDIEDKLYPARGAGQGVGFVRAKAYASGTGPAFHERDWNPTEDVATATGFTGPSTSYTSIAYSGTMETCLMVRMPLNGLSSRGKPVYTRKFFRGIGPIVDEYITGNPISAADLATIAATTAPWESGMGANLWVVIGKNGRQASGPPAGEAYIGNHQVRRGRRRKAVTTATNAPSLLSEILQTAQQAQKILREVPVPVE